MDKKRKIVLSIAIISVLLAGLWLVWQFALRDSVETSKRNKEIFSRVFEQGIPGYAEEERPPIAGYRFTSFRPVTHSDPEIRRVVERVLVTVFEFHDNKAAEREIERASLVYLWDWREEIIGEATIRTGYLLDLENRIYPEAYVAWTEDNVYFEILAQPKQEYVGAEDKEFLYRAAKEVAENILHAK